MKYPYSKALFATSAVWLTTLATGCGMTGGSVSGNAGQTVTPASKATGMRGFANGGNLPITGASVTIYVVGINTPTTTPTVSTGYGSGATSIATTTTDSTGSFSFPSGSYTCPAPTREAYIAVSGGNPGLSGTVNNTSSVMMAALGPCPAGGNLLVGDPTNGIAPITYIDVDEVTTVAAVWALQQFMAPPSSANAGAPNIGAPNTTYSNGLSGANALSVQSGVVGLNNAFTTAKMMADISNGASPNTNYPYATPETAKINTLADIIAACVNTDPTSSTICSSLFFDATPTGSTVAVDTTQALWYMAQNPINNLAALYNYKSGTPPFVPFYSAPNTLSGSVPSATAFNDTTIAISYAPSSNSLPVLGHSFGLAIDAYGNAWFGNQTQAAITNASPTGAVAASVAELGPDGSVLVAPVTTFPLSTTAGSASKFTVQQPTNTRTITAPTQLAIDLTNRPWLANADVAYTGGTTACTTTNVCTGDVGVFSASTGTSIAGATSATGYLVGYGPSGLAIDGSNNVFVSNSGSTTGAIAARSVSKMSGLDGSSFTYSTVSSSTPPNGLTGGSAYMGIDSNPNVAGGIVWVADFTACPQTIGSTTLDYGLLSLYGGSADTGLSKSEVGTNYDPYITLGAGTAAGSSQGNCNATNLTIGQILQSSMANPTSFAFDRNNGAWLTNEVHSSTGFDGLTYMTAPSDATGAIPSSVTLINGVASTSTTTTATDGTTLDVPEFLEVDGNNNVWGSNNSARSVFEASVNTSGATPAITLLTPGQGSPIPGAAYGIGFVHNTINSRTLAIDPSGNVWVTNEGTTLYTNQSGSNTSETNSVTVIVGAAAPVITPMSLRLHNSKLGQKP